ncbi:hypothetical protein [Oceanivirga salmonicida]|uniref:hypothetical protein n=1 Tax=Oceanivirga salmonicida TaxID=1769291 RepID=UPI00082DE471|nr:hypothetical protein [Oceanivirga salmonicida]
MLKMRKYKVFIGLFSFMSVLSLANYGNAEIRPQPRYIDFENLSDSKKDVFIVNEAHKSFIMRANNYEVSNLMDIENNKSSGENFLEVLEDNNKKIKAQTNMFTLCNKGKCMIKTIVNVDKKEIIEDNPMEVGASVAYAYSNISKNNLNNIDIGINFKFKIPDYKLLLKLKQDFNYTNMKYVREFKQNYYGLSGAANISTSIGNKFFVEPELRVAYAYNFKGKVLDQNNDEITLNGKLDGSLGAGLKVGYMFGEKIKFKLSLGYSFDKEFYSMNDRYRMFNKEVIKNSPEDINHSVIGSIKINIKDKHNIKILFGKSSKVYTAGLLYSTNW